MIECYFEPARQKGEFTGSGSRKGWDITSVTGAKDLFHQNSIPLPLSPGSLASFSLSENVLGSCTSSMLMTKFTSSQISREKGPYLSQF